jgi:lipoyl(octanoyl) transferase
VPCGIADKPVGSLAQFRPDIQFEEMRQLVAAQFAEVFEVQLLAL